MSEKHLKEVYVEHSTNHYYNDHRATVGSLKKALDAFDDDLHIGVRFDSGLAYTDINEIFELDKKFNLVIINCD